MGKSTINCHFQVRKLLVITRGYILVALVVYDFENRLPPNPMVKCYFWDLLGTLEKNSSP